MAQSKEVDFDSLNPATGAVLGTYPQQNEAEVRTAVQSARLTSEQWREIGFHGRRKVLLKWSDYLLAHIDDLTSLVSLETGKPISDAKLEAALAAGHIAWAARHAESVMRTSHRSPGLLMAFMVNGLRYRIGDSRCMPLLSVVIETVKKIERYKEATVGSAENAAKISIAIEHELGGTGENPFINQLSKAVNFESNLDIPVDINGKPLSNEVAAVTNQQAVNMPPGAKLKQIEHMAEVHFTEFYNTNKDAIAAACDIPSSVVFMKHDGSYSASRADLKDWEHTLMVGRNEFAIQFYQRVYNVWLWLEVMTMKISLPNYIKAYSEKNIVAIDAYNQARWKGPTVPHIDPLKEVQAVRLMLGIQGESLPLITMEEATDFLNTGDSDENMKQFKDELDEAKTNGVYMEPIRGGGQSSNNE
jgi:capsid protein